MFRKLLLLWYLEHTFWGKDTCLGEELGYWAVELVTWLCRGFVYRIICGNQMGVVVLVGSLKKWLGVRKLGSSPVSATNQLCDFEHFKIIFHFLNCQTGITNFSRL